MSYAVPDPHDRPGRAPREVRGRLVVVAAALATLGVIAAPGLLSLLGTGGTSAPVVAEDRVSRHAQRVLEELPDAYTAAGAVVVPAETDPHVVWIGAVSAGRVDGQVLALDVRGLVPFGTLPTRGPMPEWRSQVRPDDLVFSDVGPLYFACTPGTSGTGCHGSVLMQHAGSWHQLGVDAGAPGRGSVTRVSVLAGGGEAGLWLGWMPAGAATGWATVVGQTSVREVPVRVAETGAGGGARMWRLRSGDPVSAVSFRDAQGAVLERVPVTD